MNLPMEPAAPDFARGVAPTEGYSYRVWWIPQIPGKPFYVEVVDLLTAHALTIVLAQYDLFQYDNNIKPDYSNVGGIDRWTGEDGGSWSDVDPEDIAALEVS